VHDGCSKILSLVWELCGLTEAQCALVPTIYRSFGIVDLVLLHDLTKGLHSKRLCMLCGDVCDPLSIAS
jgi:hypothetical protein